MRVWLCLFPLLLVAGLSACNQAQRPAIQDTNTHRTIGRYQFAGKREYTNGSEIYYLDSMKGRVCYALITNDGKSDTNRCTDSQAFMDGD